MDLFGGLDCLDSKRSCGQYYTRGNPFTLKAFRDWSDMIDLRGKTILEPFAGGNHIIRALQDEGLASNFASFDIEPNHVQVQERDVLLDFPKDYDVVVTNPPWLAKNSAKRRGLPYPESLHGNSYDDLYKHCLHQCLHHTPYVAALIPATYLQSGLFRQRLHKFIALHDGDMFCDTDNPVALALFNPPQEAAPIEIYHDDEYIGVLDDFQKHLPTTNNKCAVRFNDPEGELGFIAFDNTRENSIHFCEGKKLQSYQIGHTARMITRIALGSVDNLSSMIDRLNQDIENFRSQTHDIFLTPFKGIRKDGRYRRRMDYSLARKFISCHV